jgi:hypothetical protein
MKQCRGDVPGTTTNVLSAAESSCNTVSSACVKAAAGLPRWETRDLQQALHTCTVVEDDPCRGRVCKVLPGSVVGISGFLTKAGSSEFVSLAAEFMPNPGRPSLAGEEFAAADWSMLGAATAEPSQCVHCVGVPAQDSTLLTATNLRLRPDLALETAASSSMLAGIA